MLPGVKILKRISADQMIRKFTAIMIISLLLFAVIVFTGCASTTYTSRYEDASKKEKSESPQRFSDEENTGILSDTLAEDDDDIPDDEGIDITSVISRLDQNASTNDPSADNSTLKERMLMEIIKYLNTPYKYGGKSSNGIDCSAFTQTIYHNVLSIDLSRTAREQYEQGIEINNRSNLEFGDLVFFNTRRRAKPGHVGIYIGDDLFAHASSKNGVIVSSMDQDYYSRRFMAGRRLRQGDIF